MERHATRIKRHHPGNNAGRNTLFIVAGILLLVSCSPKYGTRLQSGDLLFVRANDKNLSGAIDRVTQSGTGTHYDHIALLEKGTDGYDVFQSDMARGCEKISLNEFLKEENSPIDVYRLRKKYHHAAADATGTAKTLLGKPYNYTYILCDTAYYCSDFIQRCFAKDSIFALHPMTFKNASGKTDSTWIEFYKKLHLEVPEGKPGCNPNGMAASDKIYFVGALQRY